MDDLSAVFLLACHTMWAQIKTLSTTVPSSLGYIFAVRGEEPSANRIERARVTLSSIPKMLIYSVLPYSFPAFNPDNVYPTEIFSVVSISETELHISDLQFLYCTKGYIMFVLTVLSTNSVVKSICLDKHSFAQDVPKGKIIKFSFHKEIFWGMQIQKGAPWPLQTIPGAAHCVMWMGFALHCKHLDIAGYRVFASTSYIEAKYNQSRCSVAQKKRRLSH